MKQLTEMTTPELQAENQQLTQQRLDIKQRQTEINALLNDREKQRQLDADIAQLQKKHGVQVLVPDGIAPEDEASG